MERVQSETSIMRIGEAQALMRCLAKELDVAEPMDLN